MERLREHIAKTETDVRAIIDLCILGAETCKKYEQELKGELTPERLNEIRTDIITPRMKLQAEYTDTFQRFLMHVCQSVHLKFEMECAMLHTKPAEILLQFIGWYSYCGDISELCLQSLVRAKEKLYVGEK
jgi:hypothetical protein